VLFEVFFWLGDNVGFQQYAAWHFSACVSTVFTQLTKSVFILCRFVTKVKISVIIMLGTF